MCVVSSEVAIILVGFESPLHLYHESKNKPKTRLRHIIREIEMHLKCFREINLHISILRLFCNIRSKYRRQRAALSTRLSPQRAHNQHWHCNSKNCQYSKSESSRCGDKNTVAKAKNTIKLTLCWTDKLFLDCLEMTERKWNRDLKSSLRLREETFRERARGAILKLGAEKLNLP